MTITKVKLNKLTVYGFKGYKEQYEFNFTNGKNIIIGDNSKGKTSISDAISWVVTGKNIVGDLKNIKIVNKDSKCAYVQLQFSDQDGIIHEIERRSNSSVTITFDSDHISQEKLDEIIDPNVFLMGFNPLFFINLDAPVARDTVCSYVPSILKSDILANLKPAEAKVLEEESFDESDTNKYLTLRKRELSENEDYRKRLEGIIQKVNENIAGIVVSNELSFDEQLLLKAEKQLEELSARKPILKDLSELLLKSKTLEGTITVAQINQFNGSKRINELNNNKSNLLHAIQIEEINEFKLFNTSKMQISLEDIRGNYRNMRKNLSISISERKKLELKKVSYNEGDICPVCKQHMSAHSIDELNTELQLNLSKDKAELIKKSTGQKKSLAELEQEGKTLLAQIRTQQKTETEAKIKFENDRTKRIVQLKAEIQKIDDELKELEAKKIEFDENKVKQIQLLKNELSSLNVSEAKTENSKIQEAFNTEIASLKKNVQNEIFILRSKKEQVVSANLLRKNALISLEKNKQELIDRNAEMTKFISDAEVLQIKILSMKSFNVKKMELANALICKHLDNAEIKIQKFVESTGELKDCFEVLYNGMELKSSSSSERVKAGLEISRMIENLVNVHFPVFVDNGEGITSYKETAEQTIEVRVEKGHELSYLKDGKHSPIIHGEVAKRSKKRSIADKSEALKTA